MAAPAKPGEPTNTASLGLLASVLVLGGLIREKETENSEEVPGLGKIPIFGWLFKRKRRGKEKVNLLVIMVPHIVNSPDDVRRIHARRNEERLLFLERESSFARKDLETNVNYRSKSGLLPSVDREARRLEDEERLLRQAEEELSAERISGELGASPRLGEGSGSPRNHRRPFARQRSLRPSARRVQCYESAASAPISPQPAAADHQAMPTPAVARPAVPASRPRLPGSCSWSATS